MIERHPPTTTARRPQHLYLVVLGLAVVLTAAVVLWLLARSGGSNGTPAAKSGPTIVSQAQLERFAGSLDYPVYWAGPKPGFSYELTATNGRVWVRYLPAGVKAGDPRPNFLVIGTYRQPHGFDGLLAAAKQPDSLSKRIADGGLLVFSSERPTSVYFGYPGVKYQVEVYAPSAKSARALVVDGKATPVR
jgi:hypothetical protein